MIKKITATELHESSIATLPSRPSLPSLYSGRSLGAKELREAFDKLPHLLAERFNALIESLGLYREGEALENFAEALATGLSEGHSLADLFDDVKSGALCEYMSADGERTLGEVLASLSERLDDGIRYGVTVVGEGDLVSEVESIGGDLLVRKNASRTEFAKKEEAKALREDVNALQKSKAEKRELTKTNARLSNAMELLCGEAFTYEEAEAYSHGSCVPKNALAYASLDRLGGACSFKTGEELLPPGFVLLRHTPADPLTYAGTVTAKNRTLTFAGGDFEASATEIVLFDGTLPRGHYVLFGLQLSELLFRVKVNGELTHEANAFHNLPFFLTDEASVRITLDLTKKSISGTVYPSLKRETLVKNPVSALRTVGKNLLPNGIYDISSWSIRTTTAGTRFRDYEITSFLPHPGQYTLSFSFDQTLWQEKILYIFRSIDGGRRWIAPEGMSDGYIFTSTIGRIPFTFQYRQNERWRITLFPEDQQTLNLMKKIQLEAGKTATPYEPYTETVIPIPEEITALDCFGESLYDYTANYADFEKGTYERTVALRDYIEDDENVPMYMTDLFKTAAPVFDLPSLPLPETESDLSLLPVRAGGAVFFDTEEGGPAFFKITYQTKITEEVTP